MLAQSTVSSSPERELAVTRTLLETMETQLVAIYAEKERMRKAVGVSETTDVITRIQELEERLRRYEPGFSYSTGGEAQPSEDAPPAGEGFTNLLQRVRVLTGMVTSMAAQLNELYADRDRLYREAGIKEAQDILLQLRENDRLRVRLSVMEEQLAALYAQKHTLSQGLGVSEAGDVVALVHSVSAALETAQQTIRRLIPTGGTAPIGR